MIPALWLLVGFTAGVLAARGWISDLKASLRIAQSDLAAERRFARWAGRRVVRVEYCSWGTVDSLAGPETVEETP